MIAIMSQLTKTQTKTKTKNYITEAKLVVNLVKTLSSNYGISKLASTLGGTKSKDLNNPLKNSQYYGKGDNHSIEWWRKFIEAMIDAHYLTRRFYDLDDRTVKLVYLGDKMIDGNETTLNMKEIPSKYTTRDATSSASSITSASSTSTSSTSSTSITLGMILQGMSIDEVAEERGLKPGTIGSHICKELEADINCIDHQRLYQVIGLTDEVYNDIIKASEGHAKLKPIKEALPDTVTYDQIKISNLIHRSTL